jgi:hypothetical protein
MTMNLQTTYNQFPPVGYAGTLESSYPAQIETWLNADVVSMPFGTAVALKTSSPATPKDVIVPLASSGNGSKLQGIIVHSNDYSRVWTASDGTVYGDLDGTGLRPGVFLNILKRGTILVVCETGCSVGDNVYVSFTAAGTYTAGGQLGNANTSSDCIEVAGMWLDTVTAGNLARVQVDFTQGLS